MAEEGEETKPQGGEEPPKSAEENAGESKAGAAGILPSVALNVWPPSQRTREAVIQRLVQTLSTESVLSKRYGVLSPSDASDAARRIEEEAFATASASSAPIAASVDDGIKTLQIYSEEISQRMLETVKAKASSVSRSSPATTPPPSDGGATVENALPTAAGGESSASSSA
ncbi:MFP1 attachment factor 1-like [Phoenix dactylifera]|uniref:MFP1 attachment factor 1-like n=1 Tax=Phoenix dactylifera TaxID=42345 RepID=A0A8B7C260_PHODC|nr:MFP1 attachment factor 1-like [Phoenix dactylifera]